MLPLNNIKNFCFSSSSALFFYLYYYYYSCSYLITQRKLEKINIYLYSNGKAINFVIANLRKMQILNTYLISQMNSINRNANKINLKYSNTHIYVKVFKVFFPLIPEIFLAFTVNSHLQ